MERQGKEHIYMITTTGVRSLAKHEMEIADTSIRRLDEMDLPRESLLRLLNKLKHHVRTAWCSNCGGNDIEWGGLPDKVEVETCVECGSANVMSGTLSEYEAFLKEKGFSEKELVFKLYEGSALAEHREITLIGETAGLLRLKPSIPAYAEAFVYVDKKHMSVAKDIVGHLETEKLTRDLTKSAYAAFYELEKGDRTLSTWREELDCIKRALDTDLTMVIRFDGRKTRSGVNWEQETMLAEEDYGHRQKELADLRTAAETNRREILESFLIDFFRDGENVYDAFSALIEYWTWGEFPNPPTTEELEVIVQDWARQSLLDIETSRFAHFTEKGTESLVYNEVRKWTEVERAVQTIYHKKHGGLPPYRDRDVFKTDDTSAAVGYGWH
jgi:hypothetical protein